MFFVKWNKERSGYVEVRNKRGVWIYGFVLLYFALCTTFILNVRAVVTVSAVIREETK